MALSPQELLAIEIDSAWEAFCDEDAGRHAKLQQLNNEFYLLLKLAHAQGYTVALRNVIRAQQL